jgi:hypothetical protein
VLLAHLHRVSPKQSLPPGQRNQRRVSPTAIGAATIVPRQLLSSVPPSSNRVRTSFQRSAWSLEKAGISNPAEYFKDKKIRATGKVKEVDGVPRIEIDDAKQITRVGRK